MAECQNESSKRSERSQIGVLSDTEIENYCTQKPPLISPWDEKCTKPAGYELHVGDEYKRSFDKTIKSLNENEIIFLPPNEICYVLTKEEVNIPTTICGIIFPKQTRVLEGVLMYPQPPLQPGSSGKLYVLLHNLSNKEVEIRKGDHLATLVFIGLCSDVKKSYGVRDGDKYQSKNTLRELGVTRRYRPILWELNDRINGVENEMRSFREKLILWYYPIMLGVLTVIITILSILIFVKTV